MLIMDLNVQFFLYCMYLCFVCVLNHICLHCTHIQIYRLTVMKLKRSMVFPADTDTDRLEWKVPLCVSEEQLIE